jgi:hypothetical protein
MALRYLISGGDGDWNDTSNWSTSSGGASGASVPTSADDVIFDNNSNNADITVDVVTTSGSLTISDYTGTITLNTVLNILNGDITLNSQPVWAGSSILRHQCQTSFTITLTCNGYWLGNYRATQVGSTVCTLVLNGDVFVEGNLEFYENAAASGFIVQNQVDVYLKGNYRVFRSSNNISDFTLIFVGDNPQFVTIDGNNTINQHWVINSTSNVILNTQIVWNQSRSLTYISGNLVQNGNRILINNTNFTFDTNSLILQIVVFVKISSSRTITLASDLLINGEFRVAIPSSGGATKNTHFVSNIPGTPRKLTLIGNVDQSQVYFAIPSADIDSSDGNTIFTIGISPVGINWKRLDELKQNITKISIT